MHLETLKNTLSDPAEGEPRPRREGAVLYMLAGRSGAGKSTYAARLAERPGTFLFCEETLLAELYPGELEEPGGRIGASIRLRHALKDTIIGLLKEGVSVVLDFPANTPDSRRWGRELFEAAGVRHELHLLDIPAMICTARLRARNLRHLPGAPARRLDEERLDEAGSFFLPPLPQEGFHVIRHAE